MAERDDRRDGDTKTDRVNPGYAIFQIARALTTSEEHPDPATRERAREKIARWERILGSILTGSAEYGSRTPITGVPAWATPEVVTGGFATGALLAAGALQEHEFEVLGKLPRVPDGQERRALNAHFLTEDGLRDLRERLTTGRYDVGVPEEGALLVVAWLVENHRTQEARELLETISPYFEKLRFYPIPQEHGRRSGARVHLQDVGSTIGDLRKIGPNRRVLAQKEAVEVWAPFHDRVVALFLETVECEWPCRRYPTGWAERAGLLLEEYERLRKVHALCGKPERAGGHFSQLKGFLARCAARPESLTGRDVGRIRLILSRYVQKRGVPDSPRCVEARCRQQRDVAGPAFHEIAGVVISRLEDHRKSDGLDDVEPLSRAVTVEESAIFAVPAATPIPDAIRRKVQRCLNETVAVLVERGLITSGDTLARVLPQMVSGLRAAAISDPALRQLYSAIYRAFRRRRSLLLLNLESQVRIEELPWIAVIEQFRKESLSTRDLARQTLEEVAYLTISSFPHALLPNKLLQELRALAKGADLDLPLVDEVAADIFEGSFSGKFLGSAKVMAELLEDTLYTTYYGIDCQELGRIRPPVDREQRSLLSWAVRTGPDDFARLCAARAGVSPGVSDPATNGMVIEQQQILTTQNLAVLFSRLDLVEALRGHLVPMARRCFEWVCERQQIKMVRWHARLVAVKNAAYAWRQMVFFLALLPADDVAAFLRWAEEHLGRQTQEFRDRFCHALSGLSLAAEGCPLDSESARRKGARRFLGWSRTRHWLLADEPDPVSR